MPERQELMVFFEESSTYMTLEDGSPLRIGSDRDAEISRPGSTLLPTHAVVTASGSRVRLEALGEGVRVNGRPVSTARVLDSGDTVEIAETTMVLKRHRDGARAAETITPMEIRHRLDQEIERSLRRHRQVAVGVLTLDRRSEDAAKDEIVAAIGDVLRYEDLVSFDENGEIVVVLPDTDERARIPLERLLQRLHRSAPEAQAGMALCPDDAHTVDELIVGARLAAKDADAGRLLPVGARGRPRQVGSTQVIAVDPSIRSLLTLAERLAASELPVLVSGETGVGKEVVAQALHHWSPRRKGPLVSVNCAAVTDALFESELFGHVKGAFTGAASDKMGFFEKAGDGTLLLDEIGECPLSSQAKLLRVLETRKASPVGSVDEYDVRARIVASTNRDLDAEVDAGRFRRDLYFRLNAARVVVPPLRDRRIEITPLARHFLADACVRAGREELALASDALQLLGLHPWPGNIRELKNLMDYLAATVDGEVITTEHLPPSVRDAAPPWYGGLGTEPDDGAPAARRSKRTFRPLREEIADLERTRMLEALAETGGERKTAATLIGMPLRTFVAKMKTYAIDVPPLRGRRARAG